jgi:acetyl-CoA carboxylase biotin carboxyl carrier protein
MCLDAEIVGVEMGSAKASNQVRSAALGLRKGECSMSEEVTAPVSGKVWKILVKVGDTVQSEDELMILEAMKMENPIYSPIDGKVAAIKVAENDQVEPNQLLIIIE